MCPDCYSELLTFTDPATGDPWQGCSAAGCGYSQPTAV